MRLSRIPSYKSKASIQAEGPFSFSAYLLKLWRSRHFIFRRSAPPSFKRRLSQVCAFGAFFMPAEPARRFAPIKTGICAQRILSPISEAASVPYKNPSPQATPLKAVSRKP